MFSIGDNGSAMDTFLIICLWCIWPTAHTHTRTHTFYIPTPPDLCCVVSLPTVRMSRFFSFFGAMSPGHWRRCLDELMSLGVFLGQRLRHVGIWKAPLWTNLTNNFHQAPLQDQVELLSAWDHVCFFSPTLSCFSPYGFLLVALFD